MSEDLFNVGPILGKGYPEFDENQTRDSKGRWTTGRGAGAGKPKGSAGGKGKMKAKAPSKKPAAKPAAKPKSKPKPAPKPKAKEKPKEKAPPPKLRKPRAKPQAEKPVEKPTEQAPEEVKPKEEAPVERPQTSGMDARDRKRLDSLYEQYDRFDAQLSEATVLRDKAFANREDAYYLYGAASGPGTEDYWDRRYRRFDAEYQLYDQRVKQLEASRQRTRSDINDLEDRLRGSKKRLLKAMTFTQALAKMTPNHGNPGPNDPLGLVFGWAIVCDEKGDPYFDSQGDHIPQDAMLRASMDFMMSKRDLKVMHKGKRVGEVVYAWPVTDDISKAMGLGGSRTGLMIGVKPDDPRMLERFRSGEFTGFSIGGNRLIDEPVEG
jgi:hypothetical protein